MLVEEMVTDCRTNPVEIVSEWSPFLFLFLHLILCNLCQSRRSFCFSFLQSWLFILIVWCYLYWIWMHTPNAHYGIVVLILCIVKDSSCLRAFAFFSWCKMQQFKQPFIPRHPTQFKKKPTHCLNMDKALFVYWIGQWRETGNVERKRGGWHITMVPSWNGIGDIEIKT